MNIKYLTKLKDNPTFKTKGSDFVKTLVPISTQEIIDLEAAYNNGQAFPLALKELLSLSGKECYVLDYGLNETQAEMQEEARGDLINYGRNLSINRPFYVIDVYNAGTQFLFIYLDQDIDDPLVYEAFLEVNNPSWIRSMECTLSQVIDSRLTKILSGFNPF